MSESSTGDTSPRTETLTGGEAVIVALEALGVTHVFGIPSVHNLPIYDAIERRGTIEAVGVRHEQGAVHAADGYARVTGRLGVAITSTGPGAANSVPGLFEASFASSPVLMVTGQVDSGSYGKGRGFLHENDRQMPMLSAVTRRTESVRRTEDVARTVFAVADDILLGRPQPGAVEIPIDLQYRKAEVELPAAPTRRRIQADPADVERACEVLASATRLLIWAGSGVASAGASAELLQLAETLGVPVVTTINGRGAIPEDHPLCLGPNTATPEVEAVIAEADVILAVGTRFQASSTRQWGVDIPGRLVHVDADFGVIGRNYRAEVGVVADARDGLAAIAAGLKGAAGSPKIDKHFVERAQQAAREARAAGRQQIGPDHARIMDTIRELLPAESPIVRDATVPAYTWGDRQLPILLPRTSLRPTSSAIGPGLPLAFGAAVGSGQPTVLIQGDGGLMLSIGELAGLVQANAHVVVCVFNDRAYGVLRAAQQRTFGRNIGVELRAPDFAALGTSMGARGESVVGVEQFRPAFERAVATDGPTMLDIDMSALSPLGLAVAPQRR